ncbi:MAG: hypothetical protein OEM02_07940 [Desulfobulbaceae bacterium]|nr:hypothetical protein [Desulfobulbaceae bacterium]
MIELKNVENNVRLRCEVVGYQFPGSPEDNWCLLKVEIKQGDQLSLKKLIQLLEKLN